MKLPKLLPSKEALNQLLRYEPKTGEFFWRVRPVTMFAMESRPALPKRGGFKGEKPRSAEHACNQWNARWAGQPAATLKKGYWYLTINYQKLLAHRVAYKIMTGVDPIEVDHIDGNRSNNKWSNLRNGTRSENARNTALKSNNTSGHHGVYFSPRAQKWRANIALGAFDSKEQAIEARKHAEAILGFNPNHGRAISLWETENEFRSQSGIRGVVWLAEKECWLAQITVAGQYHFLGHFASKDDAIEARRMAEEEHYGQTEETSSPAS
jgi:HNH endonuclease